MLSCVFPVIIYADDFVEDDHSIPFEARQYYKSGVFWIEQGDPAQACELLKHALAVYPNFKIAKQKLSIAEKALKSLAEKQEMDRIERQRRNEQRALQQREQLIKNAQYNQQPSQKKVTDMNEIRGKQCEEYCSSRYNSCRRVYGDRDMGECNNLESSCLQNCLSKIRWE